MSDESVEPAREAEADRPGVEAPPPSPGDGATGPSGRGGGLQASALAMLQARMDSLGLVGSDWRDEEGPQAGPYLPKRSPLSSHSRVAGLVTPGSRVLDLGAGGNYAATMKAKGCEVIGLDRQAPDPQVREGYAAHFVRDLDLHGLPSPEEIGRFDFVVMADILEHLRSAPAVLRGARGLMKPGGMAIASTGNVANWFIRFGLLFGRFTYHKRGILDESHVHLYTRRTFRELLRRQSFRVVRTVVTPIPFEFFAGRLAVSRGFWRAVEYLYYAMARLWPTLFAYQFILLAVPEEKR